MSGRKGKRLGVNTTWPSRALGQVFICRVYVSLCFITEPQPEHSKGMVERGREEEEKRRRREEKRKQHKNHEKIQRQKKRGFYKQAAFYKQPIKSFCAKQLDFLIAFI